MGIGNAARSASRLCPFYQQGRLQSIRLWSRRPFLPDPVGDRSVLNEPLEVQACSEFQLSYLKDSITRARYACTLPSSTFMSSFTISATRRSRSVLAAVSTAFFAASSQDFVLVPITSTTL